MEENKKNQIEEMAKNCKNCICNAVCDKKLNLRYFFDNHDCEHYQPKLPKDSVVLSNEEYEKLQNENKRLFYQNCNLRIENKSLEENLEIEALKSKEMTKGFIAKVREMLDNCETIYEDDGYLITPNVGYLMKDVDDGLDEIEKQFSVEIKE